MKLSPVAIEDFKSVCTKHAHCKAMSIIEQFQQMPDKIVELEFSEQEYRNAGSVRSTLTKAANRAHANIKIVVRKGRVFMTKEDV